ncbi:MAG: hypothetical protein AAGE18_02390 [Pseudomonadota bacterium]
MAERAAADAAGFSVDAQVSQTTEADTNSRLSPLDEGALFGSRTNVQLQALARTPRTAWSIDTGFNAQGFVGPGDNDGLNRIDPRFGSGYRFTLPRFEAGADLSFSSRATAFEQIEDSGLTEGDATQFILGLGADAKMDLDARNSLSFDLSGGITRFSEAADDLFPTSTIRGNATWRRSFSERTSGDINFGIQRFTTDNEEDTRSISLDLSAGMRTELTPRASMDFGAGVVVTRSVEDTDGASIEPGVIGDLGFRYRIARTSLEATVSQSVEPSALGELQNRTAAGLSLVHQMTPRAQLGFSAQYSLQLSVDDDGLGTDRNFVSVSPTYSVALTRDTSLNLGYAFRFADQDTGSATSHQVFLRISRAFSLLR